MIVISSLEISIVGGGIVFLILIILAVLIELVGRFIGSSQTAVKSPPKEKPKLVNSESVEIIKRDIAIITALMHQLGHEGDIKVKAIK